MKNTYSAPTLRISGDVVSQTLGKIFQLGEPSAVRGQSGSPDSQL
jgi:hypothetical protein